MNAVVSVQAWADSREVEVMLAGMDTRLSETALAGFLGAHIDPYLRKRAKERFRSEGDDVTGAWVPLASATVNIREGLGFPGAHPINKRTGELENYITAGSFNSGIPLSGVGAMLEFPGRPATGELKKKVETAQGGKKASAGQRATPARPVLGVNERDLAYTVASLTFFLTGTKGRMPSL